MRLRSRLHSAPRIEFLCRLEDKGVIAEPVPARSVLPTWYRDLPGVDGSELSATNDGMTIKRCAPFLDALGVGWIIPLAATVRLDISDAGRTVTAGWEFDREMVSNHGDFQVAGNPLEPRPPMKFHNYWSIRTPEGCSSLIVPPLNRTDGVVQMLSGVVDTDRYVAEINFPFIPIAEDGVHTLAKGTPLVQVIPFRRNDAALEGSVRSETEEEAATRHRVHRNTLAGKGWYRRHARRGH